MIVYLASTNVTAESVPMDKLSGCALTVILCKNSKFDTMTS